MPVGRYPRPNPRRLAINLSLDISTVAALELEAARRGVTQAAVAETALKLYLGDRGLPGLAERIAELQAEVVARRKRESANRKGKKV